MLIVDGVGGGEGTELRDVRAGGKGGIAAPGEDQHPERVGVVRCCGTTADLLDPVIHPESQRVAPVRPVQDNMPDAIDYEHRIDATLTMIEECRIPTIGALNGFCTGGGAAIAASLDIRIGSRNLKIGAPIARTLGNCLAIGNLNRFVRLVGEARVKYMLLTAALIDAEEAASAGFISELHADRDAVLARADEMARGITELAPLTLDATKRGLQRLRAATPLPDDSDLVEQCFGSGDFKEGVSAFFEKLKPDWKGV